MFRWLRELYQRNVAAATSRMKWTSVLIAGEAFLLRGSVCGVPRREGQRRNLLRHGETFAR